MDGRALLLGHRYDVRLDELERGGHLGDALAGRVMEIADFENLDDANLHADKHLLLLFLPFRRRERRG